MQLGNNFNSAALTLKRYPQFLELFGLINYLYLPVWRPPPVDQLCPRWPQQRPRPQTSRSKCLSSQSWLRAALRDSGIVWREKKNELAGGCRCGFSFWTIHRVSSKFCNTLALKMYAIAPSISKSKELFSKTSNVKYANVLISTGDQCEF